MGRRTEIEVFGVSFVDLMCLAFIGQIIFWINRPQPAEPQQLDAVLLTVEQYGVAHFDLKKDAVVMPARTSGSFRPPSMSGTIDPKWAILPFGRDKKLETVIDEVSLLMSYVPGGDRGPAGSFTFAFSGMSEERFEVWIPVHRDGCGTKLHIHPIQIRSTTASGGTWTSSVVHNSEVGKVDDESEWRRLARFLGMSPENHGKTFTDLTDRGLYFVKRVSGSKTGTTVWIGLEVSTQGITKLGLIDDSAASGSPVQTVPFSDPSMSEVRQLLQDKGLNVIP